MCGRFAFYSPHEAVQDIFGVDFPAPLEARYNIAPSSFVVALRAGGDETLEPAVLKWGLVPSWAKDPAIGNRMINARAETAHEKPSFRSAFKRRRCVILADGFYEWHREGDHKTPYFIALPERRPFGMAGLWEHWQDSEGSELQTCTILTTAANDAIKPLHDRMPIILPAEGVRRWCGHAGDERAAAHAFLAENDNDRIVYWPVSTVVNNPRNDGPDLIEETRPDSR
ncbi:MAG: SOS response-associated peptidase [Gammaproteobacteria bacterium]|nr:SOS response-associated peptidase [Gammaproteobacteria bacterium]NND37743.1 SOS response-associated peptidase [Gammaproteobacteria bacterium]